LADDIINAGFRNAARRVPLTAGRPNLKTVRQVILPARLARVVGAILLAASRAIRRDNDVVMGAGAAARLVTEPFRR